MLPPTLDEVPPRISVVVPTYKRPELLARCLDALLAQSIGVPAYEIVVIDDGHDERTRAWVEQRALTLPAAFLRYLRPLRGRGPAVARNAGWRSARGEIVAFTDDDTVPARDWLEQGERALRAQPLAGLGGRVVVPPMGAGAPTDHELMTRGLERAEFVTANAFVWRDDLACIGGFDERFERAWREDSDLQFRLEALGRPVGRCEDAVVQHPVRPERWGVSLRQQKNVFFDALLYRKHPRLYRERVRRVPPYGYYASVALALGALVCVLAGRLQLAALCAALMLVLLARLAWRRLRHTSHEPAHVLEMLASSALIPFLSVYWRLRGAWHFRAWFL